VRTALFAIVYLGCTFYSRNADSFLALYDGQHCKFPFIFSTSLKILPNGKTSSIK
jgi:hypothetical protein